MDAISKDIEYYKDNRLNFITLYAGKFIVIKNSQIIGIYDTRSNASDETLKSHIAGSFIIERPMELKKK